jgi:hypothetical protein
MWGEAWSRETLTRINVAVLPGFSTNPVGEWIRLVGRSLRERSAELHHSKPDGVFEADGAFGKAALPDRAFRAPSFYS